jgi:hypothetical protein
MLLICVKLYDEIFYYGGIDCCWRRGKGEGRKGVITILRIIIY